MYDVIIVGLGPAGAAAAIYCLRFGLKTFAIFQDFGLVTTAHLVENYPGFEAISGIELMDKFYNHAKKFGLESLNEETVKAEKTPNGFKVTSASGKAIEGKVIIMACGSKPRHLNVKGEAEFSHGKGVSYCATCDAPMYKNKEVIVVGGTDEAAVTAIMLTEHAKKVYLTFKGSKLAVHDDFMEIMKQKKVEIILNDTIKEIQGERFVKNVLLESGKNIPVQGVFVEIGSVPSTDLAMQLGLELQERLVKVSAAQETNVKGVFAAGDFTNAMNHVRQVITSGAQGCIAAGTAYTYVSGSTIKMQISK